MYKFVDLFDNGAFVIMKGEPRCNELGYFTAHGLYVDKEGREFVASLLFQPELDEGENIDEMTFDEALQRGWIDYDVYVDEPVEI